MTEHEGIKPRLDYLIVCDAVAMGPDGRKTLYGVFDKLVFFRFPALYPQCCIVSRWAYGAGSHALRVRILDSDNQVVFDPKVDCKFELKDPLTSAEIVLTVQGLRFPKPSTYTIEITLDGHVETEQKYLRVEQIQPQKNFPPSAQG